MHTYTITQLTQLIAAARSWQRFGVHDSAALCQNAADTPESAVPLEYKEYMLNHARDPCTIWRQVPLITVDSKKRLEHGCRLAGWWSFFLWLGIRGPACSNLLASIWAMACTISTHHTYNRTYKHQTIRYNELTQRSLGTPKRLNRPRQSPRPASLMASHGLYWSG